jgi:hypothetical protein
MCNIETIDAELRLLWRAWRVARETGYAPNTAFIDALLDERAAWQSPTGDAESPHP